MELEALDLREWLTFPSRGPSLNFRLEWPVGGGWGRAEIQHPSPKVWTELGPGVLKAEAGVQGAILS